MKSVSPALILAGGLGTRLRSVDGGLPKVMVPVCGQPFLYWLVKSLEVKGFKSFIFSIGFRAEAIEAFDWNAKFPEVTFKFIKEASPLGTGGAVQNVFSKIPFLNSAWVINGDTLLENPPGPREARGDDEVVYVALNPSEVFDAKPNLVVDKDYVTEVQAGAGQLFDGGQVFVNAAAVNAFSGEAPFSFHQMIEKSFIHKKVGFKLVSGTCYDIGTPQRLLRFENYIKTKASL